MSPETTMAAQAADDDDVAAGHRCLLLADDDRAGKHSVDQLHGAPHIRPGAVRPVCCVRRAYRHWRPDTVRRRTAAHWRTEALTRRFLSRQGPCRSADAGEGHAVAHGLELVECTVLGSFGVEPGEVVGAGVVVERRRCGPCARSRSSMECWMATLAFCGSAPGGDAPVAGAEVGVRVLRAGHGRGAERALQVGVAGSGSGRLHPAGGLVAARTGARPRRPGVRRWGTGSCRRRSRR